MRKFAIIFAVAAAFNCVCYAQDLELTDVIREAREAALLAHSNSAAECAQKTEKTETAKTVESVGTVGANSCQTKPCGGEVNANEKLAVPPKFPLPKDF